MTTERYVGWYATVSDVVNAINKINGSKTTKFVFTNGYIKKETTPKWNKEPMSYADRMHETDRLRYIQQEANGDMKLLRKLAMKRASLSGPDKIRRFATVLYETGYVTLAKEILELA